METSNPYQTPEADVELTQQAFQTPKVFALSGRIGRLRYFAYSVIYSIIALSIAIGSSIVFADVLGELGRTILLMLAMIPPYAVAMRRRLNDLGHTGWWAALGFIPIVGGIVGLYLLFAGGEPNENQYGLAPDKGSKVLPVVVGVLFVLFLGLLLAVFVPAYQEYTEGAATISSSQAEQ